MVHNFSKNFELVTVFQVIIYKYCVNSPIILVCIPIDGFFDGYFDGYWYTYVYILIIYGYLFGNSGIMILVHTSFLNIDGYFDGFVDGYWYIYIYIHINHL